jgi:hypothetical protein
MEEKGTGIFSDLSPLQQWATQVHEMYQAMLAAGFSSVEALTLIGTMTKNSDD